jgi:hypothetical protein
VILFGASQPIVICAIDWCELRNDAYDRWRDALAEAAGTTRQHVLIHCVHQHDAPYADLYAQRLLNEYGLPDAMVSLEFHEQMVTYVAAAAKRSVASRQEITHFGTGQAEVDRIACNRRVELGGHARFNRYSFTRDRAVRDADEGEIDPMLKTITFFNGDRAIASLHCYATHPMSYYGRGEVSYDFVGMARERLQRADPGVLQIYLTGCAGDLVAAKYNDGTQAGRAELAERLFQAMSAAQKSAVRHPFEQIDFRVGKLQYTARSSGSFSAEAAKELLANPRAAKRSRIEAALTLSWQRRVASGQAIDLPVIDFGSAKFVLLPAEAFVHYQLAAQRMLPEGFIMTAGFGECAPGYIPTDRAEREGFVAEHGYDWIAPLPEKTTLSALRAILLPQ